MPAPPKTRVIASIDLWCSAMRRSRASGVSSMRHTRRSCTSNGGGAYTGWYVWPVAESKQRPSENSRASSSGRSTRMTASGRRSAQRSPPTTARACDAVRGKPSSSQPLLAASVPLLIRSWSTRSTSSSGSSSPAAMAREASSPRGRPARASPRSSAPTPMQRTRKACESIGAIVPLPVATPPNSTTRSGGSGGFCERLFRTKSRAASRRTLGCAYWKGGHVTSSDLGT
mmetsp:Transcript_7917/g.24771  ORF Transcript_7917/g.24771 Transcript_7917/m.24771 type:complete len:229 (+) Transcript_7917:438-1124(+)